jgi:hypothetical protein
MVFLFFPPYSTKPVKDHQSSPIKEENKKFLTRKSSGGHQARKRKKGRKNLSPRNKEENKRSKKIKEENSNGCDTGYGYIYFRILRICAVAENDRYPDTV